MARHVSGMSLHAGLEGSLLEAMKVNTGHPLHVEYARVVVTAEESCSQAVESASSAAANNYLEIRRVFSHDPWRCRVCTSAFSLALLRYLLTILPFGNVRNMLCYYML